MYRWIVLVVVLFGLAPVAVAQQTDTTILLPNRLVISSVSNPKKHHILDSNGRISVICVNKTDSIIRTQYRELRGKLVHYTDSSLALHVHDESISTYKHDGTYSTYYYYQKRDSVKQHFDTLLFSEIHSVRHDKGKHRKTIGMMQSTAYVFAVACFGVVVTSLVFPKSPILTNGKNALIVTSTSMAAGALSYLFYPKLYKVNNQLKKNKTIKWKIEVL
ncbi:MAG: hypothetical protein A3D31_01575 [Candidatus Fluviicola riflensis]|nr:MAG: hypothetical protein CHH17_03965 [Candidatus Fluviicola riflensis]OGS76291.1 MAG: hypothetical protein A3D31_01575 [Candidatus Fluviicola riflensis]OGS83165.1 MAG: hypothetical protein A2724_00265 [Fluviicola sp. RIFCSPHIGHO2_01_FULL_43_53]OGS83823.1 MAG: hypothetical protein A3E30_18180 [Fluviicola sp. RIFCSPHIGHO2_12_FULL_43_24]